MLDAVLKRSDDAFADVDDEKEEEKKEEELRGGGRGVGRWEEEENAYDNDISHTQCHMF